MEFVMLHDNLCNSVEHAQNYQQIRASGKMYGASVADLASLFMQTCKFNSHLTKLYTGRLASTNASIDEFLHHAKKYRVCAKLPTLALAIHHFCSDACNG